jgi:hypothetical protein
MKKRREVFHLHVRGDVGTPLHTAIMNYCAEHDLTNQEFLTLACRSLLVKELFATLAIDQTKAVRGKGKRKKVLKLPKTIDGPLRWVILNTEDQS